MRIQSISTGMAIVCLALLPASAAAQKGKGGGKPPTATTHGPSTHAKGPSTTTHGKAPTTTTTHGKAPTTTTAHGGPKAATATTTKTHGNPHTAAATTSGGTTTAAAGTTTAAGTTAASATAGTSTTTTPNPIAQKLTGKPLGTRIEGMLPTGMTLNTASSGFRNQGQFIAAVHVSQNLGIPFADLKAAMLGTTAATTALTTTGTATTSTTTSTPLSLGQAIQKLRPFANATTEVTRAENQTAADLNTITTTTTTKKRGQ